MLQQGFQFDFACLIRGPNKLEFQPIIPYWKA